MQLMLRQLQKRWQPNYTAAEVRDLFELWRDHYQVNRAAEKRGAIERTGDRARDRCHVRVRHRARGSATACRCRIVGVTTPPPSAR
jgi:hypothetical protein